MPFRQLVLKQEALKKKCLIAYFVVSNALVSSSEGIPLRSSNLVELEVERRRFSFLFIFCNVLLFPAGCSFSDF